MKLLHSISRGRRIKPVGTVAALTSAALLFAACGSTASSTTTTSSGSSTTAAGSSTTAAGSSTTSATAITESYDATLANLVPASFRSKGTLVVAANATYPPDEYFASDNVTIIGFDPDLASAVGQILGLKFNFVNTAFANIIPGLQAGRYDLGWSSATATTARQDVVNFVNYFNAGIGFIVPSSSTLSINGLSDLCGVKLAVEAGSLEEKTATAQSTQCTAASKPAIQIQTYQTENENLLALTSGRAQVTTAGSQIIPYLVQQSHGALKSVGTPYSMAPLGIEFPKSTPVALLQAFQGALNKMIANGSYGRILAKWGEQAGAITQAQILPQSAAK